MIHSKTQGLVILLLLASALGCGTVAKKSPMMKATGADLNLDAEALRVRTRSALGPLSESIERSADEIYAATDDPQVRREALLYKTEGIPTLRTALFRADPLAALLDTWALTAQLIGYFDSGPGRERFGELASIARDGAEEMESRVTAAVATMQSDEDNQRAREVVSDWAKENPIQRSIVGRPSILIEAGKFKTKTGMGGFKMIGSLAASMDDLLRQVDAYMSQMPKQARWEAELTANDLLGPAALSGSMQQLPALADTAQRVGVTVEQLPDWISGEREAVLAEIHRDWLETLEFIHAERLETLAHLSQERAAVLEGFDGFRIETTAILQAELQGVLELLRAERATILEEIEQRGHSTIDYATDQVGELIDHAFVRTIQLLVIIFIGLLLLIASAWLLFRRVSRPA